MCEATCPMWWLGWILFKTSQRGGRYQSGGTWSTGAVLVSPPAKGGKNKKLDLWHSNENKHWAVHWWWPRLLLPFFFFFFFLTSCRFSFFCFEGQPSLTKLKANRVVWTRGAIRVNTGCCDVCVVSEWPCVVDIPDTEPVELFFSCRVRCFEKPGPPPGAHLLSHDNRTNGFHWSSRWPPTSGLWAGLQRGAVWEALLVKTHLSPRSS